MDIKDAVLNVMGTSFFGNLVTLIVGLFGMAGVVYTVKKSQKSAFTSAYFSQKFAVDSADPFKQPTPFQQDLRKYFHL